MAKVIFLLQFLCVASLSQNVSRGAEKEFKIMSSDFSGSDIYKNDILAMIQSQFSLCKYISLCKFQNISISTFTAKKSEEYPCCFECSCKPSCILEDTCCPDFDHEMYQLNKTTSELPKSKALENTSKELHCVKTHHGKVNRNNGGYTMIASCPSNFTDLSIKQRCESTFHIMDEESLGDIIPIFDKESSRSYKNKFCYLCNRINNAKDVARIQSIMFWDIRLYCSSGIRLFLYLIHDPLAFAKNSLQVSCNIVFENNEGTDDDSKACEFDDLVNTCKAKYAATEIEKICKLYTWPISTHGKRGKLETYKNYACLLCNDGKRLSKCAIQSSERSKSAFLLTKTDAYTAANKVSNETDSGFSSHLLINQSINRLFPDSKGQILCGKGLIFDDQKNVCRQVFCPVFFFVKDGECVPFFRRTIGIFYYHMFKVFLPDTLNGEDTDVVEEALVFSLNQMFLKRAGVGNYNHSLWCDENSNGTMISNRKYFVLIVLDDKYADGNYVEFLKLVYALQAVTFTLVLPEIKGMSDKVFDGLKLHITKDYRLQFNTFLSLSSEPLYLRKPERFTITTYMKRANIEDVTISQFCYRIGIDIYEINLPKSRDIIFVKRTHQVLVAPNVQRYFFETETGFLVCLEHGLNGIAQTNKYIFDSMPTKTTLLKVKNHKDSNVIDRNRLSENEIKHELGQIEKSIIAAVLTAFVVFIVIGSRWLIKKLKTRAL